MITMFRLPGKIGFQGQRCSSSSSSSTPKMEYSSNYLMSWVGYILVVRTLIPPEIQYILRQCWALLLRPYTSFFCIFHIYKKDRGAGKKNDLFKLAELYLHASGLCKVADQAVLATKSEKEKEILYKLTGMTETRRLIFLRVVFLTANF